MFESPRAHELPRFHQLRKSDSQKEGKGPTNLSFPYEAHG
jgi:hypothetical protein